MDWDALHRLAKLAHPWALEIRIEADMFSKPGTFLSDECLVIGIRLSQQDRDDERPKMHNMSKVIQVSIERAKLSAGDDDVERYVGRMIAEGNAYLAERCRKIEQGETP